ncbi:MAG: L-threonylcarbamoyladenylate synthase [Chlamydiales bacterium]
MKTVVLSPEEIERAATLLRRGELVAFPTETVYGLGAPISNNEAIAKIFSTKGRPHDNPLIVHISNTDDVARLAREIPEEFYLLAKRFWPGPLTVVLKRAGTVPASISAGLDTVAIRMPQHPVARELIEKVGEPLAAPSANLSGKPSSTSAQHVLEDFDGKIAAVLDGGSCKGGIESTVVNLAGATPVVLRPGLVTLEEIAHLIGRKVEVYSKKAGEKPASPGLLYRHYAPKAKLYLFESKEELLKHLKRSAAYKRMLLGDKRVLGPRAHLLTQQTLYTLLRKSDQEQQEEILVFCDPQMQKDLALMNRLKLASVN